MKRIIELLDKVELVERAGGTMSHWNLTNGGLRNLDNRSSEPCSNQYICEIIWAETNRSYTNWAPTKQEALEKSLTEIFNDHEEDIRLHQNNVEYELQEISLKNYI
jgi:hypothetical protein